MSEYCILIVAVVGGYLGGLPAVGETFTSGPQPYEAKIIN